MNLSDGVLIGEVKEVDLTDSGEYQEVIDERRSLNMNQEFSCSFKIPEIIEGEYKEIEE